MEDATLRLGIQWCQQGTRPTKEEVQRESKAVWSLWSQFDRLVLRDGVLYRLWHVDSPNKDHKLQLCVPRSLIHTVLESLHDSLVSGHFGYKRTLDKVRSRFYWHGLASDLEQYSTMCSACARKKGPPGAPKVPLVQRAAGFPMERIEIDMLGPLPKISNCNTYVLVITDCFPKWKEAFPLPDQKAETVAHAIETEFFCRFGTPATLHADQVCELLNIEKTRVSADRPQSSGEVERFNRVLGSILRCYVSDTQKDWDVYLPQLLLTYRSSVYSSTGYTPFFLMYGYEIPLPVDIMFGRPDGETYHGTVQWVLVLRRRKERAYEDVRENIKVAQRRQKDYYDRRVKSCSFKVSDRVWLYNASHKKGLSSKLTNKWRGPYVIVKFITDVVVRVQDEQNRREKKVRHVNRLVHCHSKTQGNVPSEISASPVERYGKPKGAEKECEQLKPNDCTPWENESDESDDEAVEPESNFNQLSQMEPHVVDRTSNASTVEVAEDVEMADAHQPECGGVERQSRPQRTCRLPARLGDFVIDMLLFNIVLGCFA